MIDKNYDTITRDAQMQQSNTVTINTLIPGSSRRSQRACDDGKW